VASFYADVIEHITTSIPPHDVNSSFDPFQSQKLEIAFGNSVVITVASATHVGNRIVYLEKAAPIAATVMATLSE
jgi:hypothetical protein